jgi:hypothetical protein
LVLQPLVLSNPRPLASGPPHPRSSKPASLKPNASPTKIRRSIWQTAVSPSKAATTYCQASLPLATVPLLVACQMVPLSQQTFSCSRGTSISHPSRLPGQSRSNPGTSTWLQGQHDEDHRQSTQPELCPEIQPGFFSREKIDLLRRKFLCGHKLIPDDLQQGSTILIWCRCSPPSKDAFS